MHFSTKTPFQRAFQRTALGRVLKFLDLLYVKTVNTIRTKNGNAVKGLFLSVVQMVVMFIFFYIFMKFSGMDKLAMIRGSFVLFMLSGVFMYITHIQTLAPVATAAVPVGGLTMHAPITSILLIVAAACSSLYVSTFSILLILFVVHTLVEPIVIENPAKLAYCFFLVWLSAVAIGVLLGGVKPFLPSFFNMLRMAYMRLNMVFSGKMFTGNSLPIIALPYFTWNPIFHIIDQTRDALFINYTARHTNLTYPLVASIFILAVGIIAMQATRILYSDSTSRRD